MNTCERGFWIDADGTIYTKHGKYEIAVPQLREDMEVLEDYCEGARKDGITKCEIIHSLPKQPHMSRLRIRRVEDVAREISLTRDCIRKKANNNKSTS
jgi:hypothetical protein